MGAFEFEPIVGCMEKEACNYNPEANISENSCEYPEQYYNCGVGCINDTDEDEICDELEVVGCHDELACNFDEIATDPGECEYTVEYYDCDGNCLNDSDGDGICDELSLIGELIPDFYSIAGIYPNPFNPTSQIKCGLPENAPVQIVVYNITGRHDH